MIHPRPPVSFRTFARRRGLSAPRRPALAWLAALVLTLAGPAAAQNASQVTPDTFAPQPQRLAGQIVFSGQPGLAAPEGADRLSIAIAGVAVEGTLPGMAGVTAALEQRLTRGRIPVFEIFAAATDLEAAYARAGYVLARVVLPAQTLVDGGRLRLVVVDGFVERIDTSAVPERVRGRLEALTAPLVGQRGLRLPDLERRILLAGDTYGVALGSALATGATPGGTIIVLEPNYRRTTGFVSVDNTQSDELGEVSIDAGLEFNSPLGLGEVFYIRGTGHPDGELFGDDPRLRTLAVGAVFPLTTDGLSFNLEASQSISSPESAGPPTRSEFDRVSARLYYPFVRARAMTVTGQVALDLQSDALDVTSVAGPLPVYRDRTRVLRLSGDVFRVTADNAIVEAGAVLSFGLDALGARSAADAAGGTPLSRAGADAQFTKLEVSGRYRRRLGEAYALSLNGRAQFSFGDPLVTAEQFDITGTQDLSAFASGTLSGDSGVVLRAELSRPVERTFGGMPATVRPYVFAAAGMVHREAPQPGEAGTVRATSYGLGVETILERQPDFSAATLRLELGQGHRDDGKPDGTRFSILGSYRF